MTPRDRSTLATAVGLFSVGAAVSHWESSLIGAGLMVIAVALLAVALIAWLRTRWAWVESCCQYLGLTGDPLDLPLAVDIRSTGFQTIGPPADNAIWLYSLQHATFTNRSDRPMSLSLRLTLPREDRGPHVTREYHAMVGEFSPLEQHLPLQEWLHCPIALEARRAETGSVGFQLWDDYEASDSNAELEISDSVSGLSVNLELVGSNATGYEPPKASASS